MRAITARWYQREVERHDVALAAPQPFALAEDGPNVRAIYGRRYASEDDRRRALAAARYRDWQERSRS